MPRSARIAPGGVVFHVLNRGIARMRLFEKVGDYEAFDRVLADTLRQAPVDEKSLLTPWPVEMPEDWVERVNQPENEKELEALRRSVHRGRPYGTPEWQKKIAMRLGLEPTLRPRGRPRVRPAHKTQNDES